MSGSEPIIATPAQARLLLNPNLLLALHTLMREPLSVTELAEQLGVGTRQAYSTVQKLQRAGIAQQVGERRRRGRPIRLYRVPQPWLVPFAQTGAVTAAEFFWQQYEARLRHLTGLVGQASVQNLEAADLQEGWGYWLEAGRLELGSRSGPLHPTPTELPLFTLRELRLSDADTEQLLRDLRQLFAEYDARSQEEAAPLALGVLLTRGNWWETAE